MDINETAKEVYRLALQKGWHDTPETEDEFVERLCNNLHDEVSELHEAWRSGDLHKPCDKAVVMEAMGFRPLTCIEEEFADIVIRALENCAHLGVDIERAIRTKYAYNQTREHRHGGKKS